MSPSRYGETRFFNAGSLNPTQKHFPLNPLQLAVKVMFRNEQFCSKMYRGTFKNPCVYAGKTWHGPCSINNQHLEKLKKVGFDVICLKDIYWAAGFLEGEGCPIFSGHSAKIGAKQVQKEPLEILQKLFKGSLRLQRRPDNSRSSPIWEWSLRGNNAAALGMTLYPLMSIKRKTQIKKMLASWKYQPNSPRNKIRCPRGHLKDRVWMLHGKKRWRICSICERNRGRKRLSSLKKRRSIQPNSQLRLNFIS